MNKTRTAFFISDRTGITAENLGHSLLSQFEGIKFKRVRLPFLDSVEKARDAVVQINAASIADGQRPLIFSTLILPAVRNIIEQSDALILDLFEMFIIPLEAELGDLLFAVVNLCRKTGVHGALALDRTNAKFTRRYGQMEALAVTRGLTFNALSLAQQDELWDEIKRGER